MLLYKTNAFREDLLYHRTVALDSVTGRTEDCQTPLSVGAWLATWRGRVCVDANNELESPTWGYIQRAAAAFIYHKQE